MDASIAEALLSGNVDLETLPDIPSKLVRVYLASTRTDTIREKCALWETVYPRLREYCRNKYGLEFQMVDLQWGMTEEWSDDSPDRELYRQELAECQNFSIGPCFMALIGQRYGNCPLPAAILELDFELIGQALRRHRNRETRDAGLLLRYYKKDENCVPAVYRLQVPQPGEVLQNGTNNHYLSDRKKPVTWVQHATALRRLIHKGIDYCIQDGVIEDADRLNYLMSDLERDILEGTQNARDPDKNCLALVRHIVDLKNYVTYPQSWKFLDTVEDEDGRVVPNRECELLYSTLEAQKLRSWLPAENIVEFEVLWKFEDGIEPKLHAGYLEKFCESVYSRMCQGVDESVQGVGHIDEQVPSLLEEVSQHWYTCRSKCEDFCREVRAEHLEVIRTYVISNDQHPLIVHGEAGSGKSSLIARSAFEAAGWMDSQVYVIVQFIGETLRSRDVSFILRTICRQVCHLLGREVDTLPTSYKEIYNCYVELLNSIPNNQTLVIFLDAINDLLPNHNAHQMGWIPKKMRENVKFVVSLRPGELKLLDRLRSDIVSDETHYLELTPLNSYDCFFLLDEWLALQNKSITNEQRNIIERSFQGCSLPLYIKLIFEAAKKWTSFENMDKVILPSNIGDYLHLYFDELEAKHGQVLVDSVCRYLTASVSGLSDCEMEDILSLDDHVLNDLFGDNVPLIIRVPSMCWLRLKSELRHLLVRKFCGGRNVYTWRYSSVLKVVTSRYMANKDLEREVNSIMADHFLGRWSGKSKPYKAPNSSKNSVQKINCDRYVPKQPLTFGLENESSIVRYNLRQYNQVPRHLYLSGRLDEFNKRVLFSYEWLYNKAKASSLEEVLLDFVLNPGVEAVLVERALRDARRYLEDSFEIMGTELSGRLLCYYATHPNIRRLVDECDSAGLQHCALVPNFPYHEIPGSPLKYTMECPKIPTAFALIGNDSRYLIAKPKNSRSVYVFDLLTGEECGEVTTSIGDLYVSNDSPYFIIVDRNSDKAIKLHDVSDGKFLGQLIPLNHLKLDCKEKYKLGAISMTGGIMCAIVTTDKSYLCISSLAQCSFLEVRGLEGKANICEITPDAKVVFCNANNKLHSYSLETYEQLMATTLEHKPIQLVFRSDATKAFLINGVENKIYVLHLRDGALELIYKVVLSEYFPDDCIQRLSMSTNQELLLVRGNNNLVVYHISTERAICRIQRPSDIPKEFKLPKSHYTDIHFTQACFSSDNKFVVASIFRHIYVWHAANGRLLTSLHAPVGIISDLLIPEGRGQVVSHLGGSRDIHVWGIGDAIDHVESLDTLTSRVSEIVLTADDRTAFVKCKNSDELGVVDINSGVLLDLLTHPRPVVSFSATPDGSYLFVSTNPNRSNSANKIWFVEKRKIIHEFGDAPAINVSLTSEKSIIAVYQETEGYNAPYTIEKYTFANESYDEYRIPHSMKYVLDTPFITPQDKYLVVLTADDFDVHNATHINPTICAIANKSNMAMSTFSANELRDVVQIRRILKIQPIPNNSYTVIVLFTNEPDAVNKPTRLEGYNHCYGFMIFDICGGVVCQVIDDFLAPSTPLNAILFTDDVSLCVDHQSNVFDMGTGYYLKTLVEGSSQPRKLALNGKVALFLDGNLLTVVRLSDGKQIARVNIHSVATSIAVCNDQRTVVVGCEDGAIVSYVIIDPLSDNVKDVLSKVVSRQGAPSVESRASSRAWDRIDEESIPSYSRPPSTLSTGPTDKQLLKRVKPIERARPTSDTLLYTNRKSKACSVM